MFAISLKVICISLCIMIVSSNLLETPTHESTLAGSRPGVEAGHSFLFDFRYRSYRTPRAQKASCRHGNLARLTSRPLVCRYPPRRKAWAHCFALLFIFCTPALGFRSFIIGQNAEFHSIKVSDLLRPKPTTDTIL